MSDAPTREKDGDPEMDRLHQRAVGLRQLTPQGMLLLAAETVRIAAERFRIVGRREVWLAARQAYGPIVQAAELEMRERQEGLVCDFVNGFPDGSTDPSTYSDIEDALDRLEAPSMAGGRWLTLPQRIDALGLVYRLALAEGGRGPSGEG